MYYDIMGVRVPALMLSITQLPSCFGEVICQCLSDVDELDECERSFHHRITDRSGWISGLENRLWLPRRSVVELFWEGSVFGVSEALFKVLDSSLLTRF